MRPLWVALCLNRRSAAALQLLAVNAGSGTPSQCRPRFFRRNCSQCRALQFLLCAAAAVVVFTLVTDGAGIRFHPNLDQVLARLTPQVDIHHDAEDIAHLIGDILEELGGIGHAHGLAGVVATDDQHPALRIGEAANPAEKLVPPCFLPLGVLVLFHCQLGRFGVRPPALGSWHPSGMRGVWGVHTGGIAPLNPRLIAGIPPG